MNHIKNCPCCGGNSHIREIIDSNSPIFGARYVECAQCRVTTPLIFNCGEDGTTQLLEIWNSRYIEPTVTTSPTCCYNPVYNPDDNYCLNCGESRT